MELSPAPSYKMSSSWSSASRVWPVHEEGRIRELGPSRCSVTRLIPSFWAVIIVNNSSQYLSSNKHFLRCARVPHPVLQCHDDLILHSTASESSGRHWIYSGSFPRYNYIIYFSFSLQLYRNSEFYVFRPYTRLVLPALQGGSVEKTVWENSRSSPTSPTKRTADNWLVRRGGFVSRG